MSNKVIKNYTYTRLNDSTNEAITTTIENGKVVKVERQCRFKYEKQIGK